MKLFEYNKTIKNKLKFKQNKLNNKINQLIK